MEMPAGVYELLVTEQVRAALAALSDDSLLVTEEPVPQDEQAGLLAEHVARVVAQVLEATPENQRVDLTNRVLQAVVDAAPKATDVVDLVDGKKAKRLVELRPAALSDDPRSRPLISLRDVDLLINGHDEPGLAASLRSELESADSVDLMCAFLQWSDIRLLWDDLERFAASGRPLRILTTTYVGASEVRAIEALARSGAQVKVAYETRSTHLHAKAWLFHRDSGFDTAYVGSSNLSLTTLLEGVEWNVRLSRASTPAPLEKLAATFDTYWAAPHFEVFDAERDTKRLEAALDNAYRNTPVALSAHDVTPLPQQQVALEDLGRERRRHDRWRNLVVGAPGTGKTVLAALDYKRLALEGEQHRPRLLFVAHRREVLDRSLRTFREVLHDHDFGEVHVAGHSPDEADHVFASVQSLQRINLDVLDPAHFEVVIIDGIHHAEAFTYTRLLRHLTPEVLLGLTATPHLADRTDATSWFDSRIASQLSLTLSLETDVLCPFHYFGIADDTDLSTVRWQSGRYDSNALGNLYTSNDVRSGIVLREVADKVSDPLAMRALGFCASVAHAHYMARVFMERGIPAAAVDTKTDPSRRAELLRQLRSGQLNALFAVDLFDETVEVPEVDTVLLLRPVESATLFLEHVGRGLRRSPDKACLTVLDFIGRQHPEFHFTDGLVALSGVRRSNLVPAIEQGFPFLPAGSSIRLDETAQRIVLDNVRDDVQVGRAALADELRGVDAATLADFVTHGERTLADVYRNRSSLTALRRSAGLETPEPGPDEAKLLPRVGRLLHVDDPELLRFVEQSAGEVKPPKLTKTPKRHQRLARMLFFSFWRDSGGFKSYEAGFAQVWKNPAVLAELAELAAVLAESAPFEPKSLSEHFADVPLWAHCHYTSEEILAATGLATVGKPPRPGGEIHHVKELATDVLTITLHKGDERYSPTGRYRTYAMSRELLRWEAPTSTNADAAALQRWVHQADEGTHVLLFARASDTDEIGLSAPYLCLGEADYVTHHGARATAVTWRLRTPMPAAFFAQAAVTTG